MLGVGLGFRVRRGLETVVGLGIGMVGLGIGSMVGLGIEEGIVSVLGTEMQLGR